MNIVHQPRTLECPWTQRRDGHCCGSRRASRDPYLADSGCPAQYNLENWFKVKSSTGKVVLTPAHISDTLNPTPSTLHPQPYTLNPSPSTLHP
jgi:hypothetical protein